MQCYRILKFAAAAELNNYRFPIESEPEMDLSLVSELDTTWSN